MAPVVLHVAPHPDDEALGCPAALLHLRDRGWKVISVFASLGRAADHGRRRAEAVDASSRARFEPVFLDPPLDLGLGTDLAGAATRLSEEISALAVAHRASVVVSPSPHDIHHSHETVGRAVQHAMAALPDEVRWWMWGLWSDLPAPNVFYAFDEGMLERTVHVLDAYGGELERNDYRRYLRARAAATAVSGSERVFGFGSPAATVLPYAEVLTEVRSSAGTDGRFMASEPHTLDDGPERPGSSNLDITAWVEAPSVRELLGHVREH